MGGDRQLPDDERRKYARVSTDDMISVAPLDSGDRLAVGRDFSSGGIRFEAVGFELELGDLVRVTFNVGENTVTATGRVCWATDLDPITLEVGLEFVEIDGTDQHLLAEIVRKQNEQRS